MSTAAPFVLALSVLCMGCGTLYSTSGVTTYDADDFGEAALTRHRVAILPVVAGDDLEGFRRPFAEALNEAAAAYLPTEAFEPWEATMDSLNTHGVVEAYQSAISAYRQTSIINRNVLRELARATGTRYFLFVHLDPLRVVQGTPYGVAALGRVWDAEGDVAWEGGSQSVVSGPARQNDGRLDILSTNAADALIRSMLGLEVASASEPEEASSSKGTKLLIIGVGVAAATVLLITFIGKANS